ncbi:putative ATP-grasp-modified RiPP [Streptomyces sp. NPDC020800]|uniref:putative ATP-grasp-modified RiPP n=1 Tax=Streptomyces sp. NPDC020800 TaxID=3365092 RepID=UPI003795D6F1
MCSQQTVQKFAQPFALRFARPVPPQLATNPFTYDSWSQLNRYDCGLPVASCEKGLRALGTTVSTAGSKTHFDD